MHDDKVQRFTFDGLPIRGQWVRLRKVLQDATEYRTYPDAVHQLLSAQLAAVTLFADGLKFNGAIALQSQGSGPLIRSLAECRERHKIRGIAHLRERDADPGAHLQDWLQNGQLALTLIYPEAQNNPPYQAIIALEHETLAANLEVYFNRSEQLPTRMFFAHSEEAVTGLLLQRLPEEEGATDIELQLHEDAWRTALTLVDTLKLSELAEDTPESLLRKLFSEFECRMHPARQLIYACSCSQEKSDRTLRLLPREELQAVLDEDGEVNVDCEFCGKRYRYDAFAVAALEASQADPNLH